MSGVSGVAVGANQTRPDAVTASPWRGFWAVAMAQVLVLGAALAVVLGQLEWVLITAVCVLPANAITFAVLGFARRWGVPRVAGALVIAIGLSAVIGLLLFSPRSYAWLGLVVCVPIGLVAAGIGFAADALARRFAVVGRALVVLGFVAIAVSALTSFANWDG